MSDMSVMRGGGFTFTIGAEELKRGLRPSSKLPRGNKFLYSCIGAIGKDGVLEALSASQLSIPFITDAFPYPQVFNFINFVIICGESNIFECTPDGTSAILKYSASHVGTIWTAMDFFDYVYLSNGKIAVVRDPMTGEYSNTTDVPTASAACNFNGQAFVGAPNVDAAGADIILA